MIIDILLASLWGLPCWLWLLIAGILPFILGWLFGSRFDRGSRSENGDKRTNQAGSMSPEQRAMQDKLNTFEKNEAELKYKIEQLEADLKACRDKRQRLEMQNLSYKAKLEELGALNNDNDSNTEMKLATGSLAQSGKIDLENIQREGYADFFSADNLQVVEGIGPKVETVLQENGITNWTGLSSKSPAELRSLLKANKLDMINPDSWPRQAELAAGGNWNDLAEYQRFLDGGRGDAGDFKTPVKIDQLAAAGGLVLSRGKAGKQGTINYTQIFDHDHLQVVEGIGPKVEKRLKENGIKSLADLAGTKPEALSAILKANKLQMMKPDSWPRQAELAHNGQWAELIEFQKFLDGGREKTGDFASPSKVEKMAMKKLGFSQNPEDLKIVEGIGPKIEGILKNEGIQTWADLAATPVNRLQQILANAGDRYKLAKPNTWPKQAEMAAKGEWGNLKEYQDYLDKGVDPKS